LHLAVVKGHLDIVKYLVHEGARLDVVDNEQRTPLVKAVLSGNQNHHVNYQICVTLLDGGAHACKNLLLSFCKYYFLCIVINAVDNHGKNALHYAIDFANEALVALFLSVPNCDPNFRDRDQMTPLHLAVKRNNPNIVYILLSDEHGQQADANLINRLGQTPLHMAASVGYIEIIRVLLQANIEEPCDPTLVDSQQLTAYQIAKANHHETCAKLIDEYQQGWTRLSPRREISQSINEQEINPILMNLSQHYINTRHESSDDTSSNQSSQSSKSSSRKMKPPSNQWSDRTVPSTISGKQDTRTLADMIKNNSLQPDISKTNVSQPTNQTLASMMHNIPLQRNIPETNVPKPVNQTLSNTVHSIPSQPDISLTNVSKPTNQTVSSLIHGIPLQPHETSTNKPVIRKLHNLFCYFSMSFMFSFNQLNKNNHRLYLALDPLSFNIKKPIIHQPVCQLTSH
jgi:ankyrin repeat protein